MKPEDAVRRAIIKYLEMRNWYVMITVGGAFQSGLPDLLCTHTKYGVRMIEVKLPEMKGSCFTKAQLAKFPKLYDHGAPLYILTAGDDTEYAKLFKPSNLYDYMDKQKTLREKIEGG